MSLMRMFSRRLRGRIIIFSGQSPNIILISISYPDPTVQLNPLGHEIFGNIWIRDYCWIDNGLDRDSLVDLSRYSYTVGSGNGLTLPYTL